ncbi:hypothetical protein DW1_0839 [Proteiniborus sp. DW1]|uniref:DUF3788 family protein n=1 Tax=Proteiniborus sp. DW1 TaxID=1889883 RepID=UPI00092E1054|nr:DUF3788 family protein [Proteiniborus sp. DW1]SCG82447.1 hypothetical protein DW1_0839 [Proteiniborus sp. DW1]
MTKEILTRCGYRCDLCLAYKENIDKEDRRQVLSDGWFRFFGFRIKAENIYCEGCISSDCLTACLIDKGCPVRPCVIEKGYENCSQCDKYICEKFEERAVRLEDIQDKIQEKIKRNDYRDIIKPYENIKRLNELRERQGQFSRMFNENIKPNEESMKKFIEEKNVVELWDKLINFIEHNYKLDKYINYGGKKYGWEIHYKYGKKTIISIHPERRAFTVLFTFGKKELESFNSIKDQVGKATLDLVDGTKHYHDGKWIWLRVTDNEQLNDVLILLKIKKKPNH